MRNAHPGADELQEVEGWPAPGQDEQELAREVFAVVGIEVQRLEVVAKVHVTQGRHAAGEFGKRHAHAQRAEDPVLLRELTAPVIFLVVGQLLQSHRARSMSRAFFEELMATISSIRTS